MSSFSVSTFAVGAVLCIFACWSVGNASPINSASSLHSNTGTIRLSPTIVLESAATGKYVRPSADQVSFNAKGKKCNKRAAFKLTSYLHNGMGVYTLRNLKNQKLMAARDATTITAVVLSNDMLGSVSARPEVYFILHSRADGTALESLQFRGQFLTVNHHGALTLQTGADLPYQYAGLHFTMGQYTYCALAQEERQRQQTQMPTMMALVTSPDPEVSSSLADQLKAAFAQGVQRDGGPVVVHNRIIEAAAPAPPTTPAPPATPAPTAATMLQRALATTPRPTYAPISEHILRLRQLLRAAGLTEY